MEKSLYRFEIIMSKSEDNEPSIKLIMEKSKDTLALKNNFKIYESIEELLYEDLMYSVESFFENLIYLEESVNTAEIENSR